MQNTTSGRLAVPHRKEEDIKLIANKLGLSSLTDLSNRDGTCPA